MPEIGTGLMDVALAGAGRQMTATLVVHAAEPGKAGGVALGGSLIRGVGGVAASALGAVAKPAIATMSAIGALVVVGGFSRALKIDEATTKLKALGYEGEGVRSIMDSALASVKGTAFGLDSAVTASAGALAAGVKQGAELTSYLTTVSNTAALAGTSMDDMGSIFNKVMANGKVTTEEMNQLADRGVPIWSYLSDALGVSNDELRKMIETGKVTSEMFVGALGPAVDGIAAKMGTSFKGTMSNTVAALSRFGALFAGPALALVQPWLIATTQGIDALSSIVKPITDNFSAFADGIRQAFIDAGGGVAGVQAMLEGFGNLAKGVIAILFEGDYDGGFFGAIKGFGEDSAIVDLLFRIREAAVGLPDLFAGIAKVLFLGDYDGGLLGAISGFSEDSSIVDFLFRLREGAVSAVDSIVEFFLGGGLASLLGDLGAAVNAIIPALGSAASAIATGVAAYFAAATPPMAELTHALLDGLTAGVQLVVPLLGAVLLAAFTAYADYVTAATPLVMDLTLVLFSGLVSAIDVILPLLVSGVLHAVSAYVDYVVAATPLIMDASLTLLSGLVTGLVSVIPLLLSALAALGGLHAQALVEFAPLLVDGALQLFTGLLTAYQQVFDALLAAQVELLPLVVSALTSMLPALLGAALDLYFGLVTGLLQVVPQLIVSLLEALPQIVSTLLGMLPTLVTTAVDLFFALVTGLLQMLPQLLSAIIGLLPSLVSTLISLVPTLIGAAVQVFAALVTGLLQNIGPLVNTILFEVLPGILGALAGAVPKMLEAGKNLIFGLVDGLWAVAGTIAQALVGMIGGGIEGFLGFLGIHSPSRLFADHGETVGDALVTALDDAADFVYLETAEGGLFDAYDRFREGVHSRERDTATAPREYNDYSTSSEDKQAKLQRAFTLSGATLSFGPPV